MKDKYYTIEMCFEMNSRFHGESKISRSPTPTRSARFLLRSLFFADKDELYAATGPALRCERLSSGFDFLFSLLQVEETSGAAARHRGRCDCLRPGLEDHFTNTLTVEGARLTSRFSHFLKDLLLKNNI